MADATFYNIPIGGMYDVFVTSAHVNIIDLLYIRVQ